MSIDERICGARNEDGISCQLLPDHQFTRHAGLTSDHHMVVWPRQEQDNYVPAHSMREDGLS